MNIETHPIIWTTKKIERIWDYYGTNPAYKNAYFAKHSGHRVLSEVNKLVGVTGDILDVGCGPGYLLEHMRKLPSWSSYTGIDTSEKSLEEVKCKGIDEGRRIEGFLVKDTGTIKDKSIDRVFCVEVMEHCDDNTLRNILAMIHRIVRRDGYIVITTPNAEDLNKATQICPDCGCIYHKWQHVRTWTCNDLSAFVKSCEFDIHSVFTCHFGREDIGRGIVDRFAALCRHGKNWRDSFLHLPQILLLATPQKQNKRK